MNNRFACVLALAAACAAPAALRASEPLTLTTPEQENKLGEDAYKEILQKEKLCKDKETVAFVERVAKRIMAAAPDKGFQYEISVLESPTINAFCLPGGKICVYTGVLPYCQNEAGLATVLGHEVAHAILRHGGQRMTQATVVGWVGTGLSEILKARGASAAASSIALGAYDYGSQLGLLLPYSRANETEADHEGLLYMSRAGYDPHEAVEFWKRFSTLKSATPTFLSTHPASDDREKRLEKAQKEALKLYAQSEKLGAGARLPEYCLKLTPAAPAGTSAAADPATLASLADGEIRQGLQAALSQGMRHAIAKLGKADGFYKDLAVKVLMPDQLKDIEKAARMLGRDKYADEFIENMNRAAEAAAPATADVLAQAIAQLTLQDARGILKGKHDEATQYFKKSCDANLLEKILPLVQKATADSGATKSYKSLVKKAGFAGKALLGDFDLDQYVTRKAVDGLYLKMAEEELNIRANPAGQATDILRKVFGAK
ncbi:MAG: DUF4197 family protein [Planctomycetes bacterium]|nr:DUF4197 family protein [Planctomycetota bacterium]